MAMVIFQAITISSFRITTPEEEHLMADNSLKMQKGLNKSFFNYLHSFLTNDIPAVMMKLIT